MRNKKKKLYVATGSRGNKFVSDCMRDSMLQNEYIYGMCVACPAFNKFIFSMHRKII